MSELLSQSVSESVSGSVGESVSGAFQSVSVLVNMPASVSASQ